MPLRSLTITAVRNLITPTLEPHPRLNLLFGRNGSGKSSVLEAIHLLAYGRSFRTRYVNHVITHEQDAMSIVATCTTAHLAGEHEYVIGLQRARAGEYSLKIAGETARTMSQAAELLPVQLYNINHYRLLQASPSIRRKQMDWGVFHVEHQFIHAWHTLQRVLKQRNAALKQQVSAKTLQQWDIAWCRASELVDQLRATFCKLWFERAEQFIRLFYPNLEAKLVYYRGWDERNNLADLLAQSFHREQQQGFTQHGAHRAEFRLRIGDKPGDAVLSTGQQKMIVALIQLAQSHTVHAASRKSPVYLIDDLPAELDNQAKQWLLNQLVALEGQVFLTSIERGTFDLSRFSGTAKVFHVEQGVLQEMV